MNDLKARLDRMANAVSDAQRRVTALESNSGSVDGALRDLETSVRLLLDRIQALEDNQQVSI